ncbi:MAG TPA: glycosyltransferase family 4 protein [Chitinispirillaceae bacterium]|nr:glycosyltransferase family 4 protein [Chitinispirillaceae bacterium]
MSNTSKIPVCYFSSISSFNSGMPISTSKLIGHFSTHPSFSTYCIFPSDGPFPQKARETGASVHILPFHSLKKGVKALLSLFTWFSATVKLYSFIKKENIRIVHFSDFIDFPYYPAAYLAGAVCIAHLRMCIENRFQRIFYKIWAQQFCTKVICISDAVKKNASLKDSICQIVYNPGPDPALFNPKRTFPFPTQFSKNKLNIILIANFRSVKGQEHFVNAAARIENRYPGQTHFCMIGDRLPAHQHYFNVLQSMITSFNLEKCFSIIENVPHESIANYIAHSYLLVHVPNYQEGFGGVILEAMMMGVPVVAFDSGGVRECFTNNVSGFIVAQYDTIAVAEAMEKLIVEPQLHEKMRSNALVEIKKFSYQKHFNEIENLYRSSMP